MRWCSSMVAPAEDSFLSSGKRTLSIALVWLRMCMQAGENAIFQRALTDEACAYYEIICKCCDPYAYEAVWRCHSSLLIPDLDGEKVLRQRGGAACCREGFRRVQSDGVQRAADHGLAMRACLFAGESANNVHALCDDAGRDRRLPVQLPGACAGTR